MCLVFCSFPGLVFYLFFAVLGLSCCMGFSLIVESRGYSLVAVASLIAEHALVNEL